MVVRLKVRLLGIFQRLFGRSQLLIGLEKPTPIRELIQRIVEPYPSESKRMLIDPELGDPRPNALILVNGKEISVLKGLETEVCDGDEVVLIPVSHGG